ncbi:zinc dependent phospholipase C family protein [Candidatus Uabimicrobium amorphum]|uniref:Phospholipase C/D domain-containing protein n=1 Tax=Uabimicrobium amorphum TaxID=2596890 RepID=A0A5S9IRU5_UABAM|nr:zinc dependent phospholipase C family protein [Candidatus Uabimicrobium amorphum]BBM86291.1 hypothetical protein UABAM_04677 [Candidatus Uabimicrobium amorphum]
MRKIIIFLGIIFCLVDIWAFKPKTHLYIAEIALQDAIDDGKVRIPYVDYETKEIIGYHDCTVPADILHALKNYPAQYRAGVMGPDAYPDLITGQQAIHPKYVDRWFRYLWKHAQNKGPAVKAFVLGYLTHGAGDMFGHTFVNYFSGGAFTFSPKSNAVRHITIEGCIANQTPLQQAYHNVSIAGVENFIYEYLVDAHEDSELRKTLLKGAGTDFSLPLYFSKLKTKLKRYKQDYHNWINKRNAKIDGLKKKNRRERDKFIPDYITISARLVEIQLLEAEKKTFELGRAPAVKYAEEWIDDIERGLKRWVRVAHEIAVNLMLHPSGKSDIEKIKSIAYDYITKHLLSMYGAPDVVGEALRKIEEFIQEVIDSIPGLREFIEEVGHKVETFLKFLFEKTFGMSWEEFKSYFTEPEKRFPIVFLGRPTLQQFYTEHLGISGRNEKLSEENLFPAAQNTLTMSKLIFLDRFEGNKLLKKIGSPTTLNHENFMLGFIKNLDAGSQWDCCSVKMTLSQEPNTYRNFFMDQLGALKVQAVVKDNISLDRIHEGRGIYEAKETITTTGNMTITGAKKIRMEAKKIQIGPGFKIEEGARVNLNAKD